MPNQMIQLTASDGHSFSAYKSWPDSPAKCGVIVLQEIYGVTSYIRSVCDRFSHHGYLAVAPSLYDRLGRDVVLDYKKDSSTALEFREKVPFDKVLADVAATAAHLQSIGNDVCIVGFCWGGTAAWLSAARVPGIKLSVSYYPTRLTGMVNEEPRCPVLIHLGERDHVTPLSMAGELRARHGAILEVQIYPCGHGFDCHDRKDFHQPSSALALERTLAFLSRHLPA